MRVKKLVVLIFASLLLSGCGKTNIDCFSDPGEVISEFRTFDSIFTGINMFDNVNVEMVSSNEAKVEVIAGDKLLDGVVTEVIDGELIIRNNNQCSFLRQSERYFKVIVYYTQLDSITYRSVGDLTAMSIIKSDTFKVNIFEGAGTINLRLDCSKSYLNYHFGTASLNVEGISNVNYIYQVSYGSVNALNLLTTYSYLENRSPNHCYVNASSTLEATINGKGNVYYKGNPSEITRLGAGSGELLPW